MGPKHDISDDVIKKNNMTDNELLPGLDIAHHADPKVKGWEACYRLWPYARRSKDFAHDHGQQAIT